MKNHEGNTAPQTSSNIPPNPDWNAPETAPTRETKAQARALGAKALASQSASEVAAGEALAQPIPETMATTTLPQPEISTAETSTQSEQTPGEQVLASITRWQQLYDEEEADFARFVKQQKQQSVEDLETQDKYRTWLLRSEQMAQMDWQQMRQSTNLAIQEGAISGRYAVAQAQNYGRNIRPQETIEAASAVFYQERMQNLRTEIDANEDLSESERREQIKLLGGTWRRVLDYLESTSDLYDGYDGQRRRTTMHNNMIKQLNSMNDLARSYGVQPFTLRNFMTNDFSYDRSKDRTGALDHMADFDRETVANYFHKVFAKDISREAERQERRKRLFR